MWQNRDARLYWWQSFVAGGMSGVIPRTLTAPLDVVKTLKQVGTPLGIKGYSQVLLNTFRGEGVMGFYKGNMTACIRLFPYSAVQFTAYELFKNSFISLDDGAGPHPTTRSDMRSRAAWETGRRPRSHTHEAHTKHTKHTH